MKANTPALILYFTVCIISVLFYFMEQDWLIAYSKAIVIPSISYYYYVSNHNKIDLAKSVLFFLCFIGDIFILMDYEHSFLGSLSCFFLSYIILLISLVKDSKNNRYRKMDILPMAIVLFLLGYLLFSILNLQIENLQKYFVIFLLYGLILALLGVVSILNYIATRTDKAINAVLMWICFFLSDVFYLLYNYYIDISIFQIITIATQGLSYFFMVRYLLSAGNLTDVDIELTPAKQ